MIDLCRPSVIFQLWKLVFLPNDVPYVHPSTCSSEQTFYPCINPLSTVDNFLGGFADFGHLCCLLITC